MPFRLFLIWMLLLHTFCFSCGRYQSRSQLNDQDEPRLFQLGTLGSAPPVISSLGAGAGKYSSQKASLEMKSYSIAISSALRSGLIHKKFGSEAAEHLKHYFENSGTSLVIDAEKLIKDSKFARQHFQKLYLAAKGFLYTLPEGEHNFVSRLADTIEVKDSGSWYLALGIYHGFVNVNARISKQSNGTKNYAWVFSYQVRDIYDWDSGPINPLFPLGKTVGLKVELSNHFLGEFHRQGLAQEYKVSGVIRRFERWELM